MRVLMISDVYFPRVNGVSTSIQTFARELLAKGHQVTLIAPEYHEPWHEPFEIIRIPSRYLPLDPEDRIMRVRQLRRLRRALVARGFDLVHIQTPFIAHYTGLGLARRLGVPVIASYHTFFEQYFDKYVKFVPAAWLRFVARHYSAAQCNDVDGLVVPSHAMLRILRGYGVETPAQVIPTGIELEQFRRGDGAGFRERNGISPERPVLVHVGRIAFEKNIDFLLRVLVAVKAQVPEVLLLVAGEGPARRPLQAMAEQLGLAEQVRFLGYLSRNGPLEDCYSAGDVFIFASRTETQGLVVLEALALGIPVVSTAVMGTREVLVEGRGSLIADEDEADFAAKVVRLLRDPALRRQLGRAAHHYAEEWSAPALAEQMLSLYGKVLACREGPQPIAMATADEPEF